MVHTALVASIHVRTGALFSKRFSWDDLEEAERTLDAQESAAKRPIGNAAPEKRSLLLTADIVRSLGVAE